MMPSKSCTSRSQIAVPVVLALAAKPLGSCTSQKPRNRITRRTTVFFRAPVIGCSLSRGKEGVRRAHARPHLCSKFRRRFPSGALQALQEQVSRRVGIALPRDHLGGELVQRCVLVHAAPLL